MQNLQTLAAMAEIFSGLAIVGGGLFALVQFGEHRKLRRYQVAAELCRQFSDPELGRAVTLIRRLPDGVTVDGLREMGPQYEESAQIVGMAFETMGLLVHKNLASFQLIQELTGGLLLTLWRNLEVWFKMWHACISLFCRHVCGSPGRDDAGG